MTWSSGPATAHSLERGFSWLRHSSVTRGTAVQLKVRSTTMAPCALVFDFQDIASAPSNHPWLSATATALLFLFAYVLMRQRHYRLLCNRARECPHVASITVMGGISEELQSRQVELMLRGELAAIADAYRNFSKLQTDVASTDVLMDAPGFELDLHGTIKFGGVEIPLPVITNLLRVPILHLRSRLEYLGLLRVGEPRCLALTLSFGVLRAAYPCIACLGRRAHASARLSGGAKCAAAAPG